MLYIKLLNSFDQLIVIFKSTVNIIQKRNCISVKLTLTNINNLFLVIKICCSLINALFYKIKLFELGVIFHFTLVLSKVFDNNFIQNYYWEMVSLVLGDLFLFIFSWTAWFVGPPNFHLTSHFQAHPQCLASSSPVAAVGRCVIPRAGSVASLPPTSVCRRRVCCCMPPLQTAC